ncbi:midcut-by-XrtH protein [Comamonas sp. J-3]|uniref:midcut-by-XrtH protein n=1 Tax=Comamonas trifloxystrobinivorans TaxID=3350256 RepID=UPI00372ACFC6
MTYTVSARLSAVGTAAVAGLLAGAAQAQTITTAPVAMAVAAGPVPVPAGHALTWLLLMAVLVLGLVAMLRCMGVSLHTLRSAALGAAMLALSASALWGDKVLAQLQLLQLQFTQDGGETLNVPVQALQTAGVITGFVPVEFSNASSKPLLIKSITMPTWQACFPAGAPAVPVTTASPPTATPCTVGNQVDVGKACQVDVAQLCADAIAALQGAGPSVVVADSASVNEGQTVAGNVLSNDSDADGALLVASYGVDGVRYMAGSAASAPTLGSFSLQADGAFSFTAAKPFPAADLVVNYRTHTGAEGLLTVTVNRTPHAVSDSALTTAGTAVSIPVLVNDSDPDGDTLSIQSHSSGAHGSVAVDGSSKLLYTPTAGYQGTDSFSYTISDGKGLTATASVNVTINAAPVVNTAPIANDDAAVVTENSSVTIAVRANDTDAEGDALTVIGVTQGANGSVVTDAVSGNPIYTPNSGFSGTDSFSYTITDGKGLTATASVNVTVNAAPVVNTAPIANDDTAVVTENSSVTIAVRANDTDADGDALTVVGVTQGANGSVVTDSVTGNPIYSPNSGFSGTDYFSYTIDDGHGGTATATVTITVNNGNDSPVTTNLSLYSHTATAMSGVVSATDPDGDQLSYLVSVAPSHGTVVLNAATGAFTYVPEANFLGQDSFDVTVSDGHGGTAISKVTLVMGGNRQPAPVDDYLATSKNTALTIPLVTLTANDSDPDGDQLFVSSAVGPSRGSLYFISGNLVFMPEADFVGQANFTYLVSDGQGGTNSAMVYIIVNGSP